MGAAPLAMQNATIFFYDHTLETNRRVTKPFNKLRYGTFTFFLLPFPFATYLTVSFLDALRCFIARLLTSPLTTAS